MYNKESQKSDAWMFQKKGSQMCTLSVLDMKESTKLQQSFKDLMSCPAYI